MPDGVSQYIIDRRYLIPEGRDFHNGHALDVLEVAFLEMTGTMQSKAVAFELVSGSHSAQNIRGALIGSINTLGFRLSYNVYCKAHLSC